MWRFRDEQEGLRKQIVMGIKFVEKGGILEDLVLIGRVRGGAYCQLGSLLTPWCATKLVRETGSNFGLILGWGKRLLLTNSLIFFIVLLMGQLVIRDYFSKSSDQVV